MKVHRRQRAAAGGATAAHPDPAEALVVVLGLVLEGQLPAQRNAELPALLDKKDKKRS